ncbi:hypothetical protein HDU79_001342 [Rhizoclosmatium sp. JEL0117]|nr:hypothetical protein HDU79_001342 [Rhizoclosmatium sp. JEL0117]
MSSPSTPDLPNLSQPCLYAWIASSKVQSTCGALPVVADMRNVSVKDSTSNPSQHIVHKTTRVNGRPHICKRLIRVSFTVEL